MSEGGSGMEDGALLTSRAGVARVQEALDAAGLDIPSPRPSWVWSGRPAAPSPWFPGTESPWP